MAIFAILSAPENQNIGPAIQKVYPDDHLEVRPGQWLVAAPATAQEVSGSLGVSDGANGPAIVLSIGGYFGRANPNIWDWIKTKWDAKKNG